MTDAMIQSQMKMPELEKLEREVETGLASFVKVGRALIAIQSKKGYALRGYDSMEAYCEKQFHFSLRQGQRLMLAADTAEKVEKAIGEAPRNEASARVLTQVASEPKLLEKVKRELDKTKLSVATATAEKLQEVVDKIKPQTKPMYEEPAKAKETVAAKVVESAGLTDQCPSCKETPKAYTHKDDGWHCDACGAVVRVSAVPYEIAMCPECKAPILDDSGFCRRCGSVTK